MYQRMRAKGKYWAGPRHIVIFYISLLLMSKDYVDPDWMSLPETYLELLKREGGFSIFQKKDEAKSFPAEFFPLPQMPVQYILSRIAKISTPVGLHGPPCHNFPEDISLPFW